ncbi:hypothetical protein [Hymenobacter sp.]|nr:hypothetical protein [Hymenobacter sp.]
MCSPDATWLSQAAFEQASEELIGFERTLNAELVPPGVVLDLRPLRRG